MLLGKDLVNELREDDITKYKLRESWGDRETRGDLIFFIFIWTYIYIIILGQLFSNISYFQSLMALTYMATFYPKW